MAGEHRLRRVLGPVQLTSLGVWLLVGFCIYFGYGRKHSVMARHLAHEINTHGVSPAGAPATHTGGEPDDLVE
jgi:hypothetical protein